VPERVPESRPAGLSIVEKSSLRTFVHAGFGSPV